MKKFNAIILGFFVALIDYSISLYHQLRLINNNSKSVLVEEENISPFEFDMQFEIITSTITVSYTHLTLPTTSPV